MLSSATSHFLTCSSSLYRAIKSAAVIDLAILIVYYITTWYALGAVCGFLISKPQYCSMDTQLFYNLLLQLNSVLSQKIACFLSVVLQAIYK